jgi:subtilisin family serine protease
LQNSDQFFKGLKQTEDILDKYRRNGDEKVKIAIIDSGVDTTHPHIVKLQNEAKGWKRITTLSFVDSVHNGEDFVGHGTHITSTMVRIAKWAEVYVATVVDAKGNINPQSVAKVK